ncbi:MAG TPA: PadR family transcriptional regulator [Bacteroidetes bacterium]|nr:PadR family transcriptional regulator [Bacteroidota bacterium]
MKTNELLKGTIKTILLNLLAEQGRMYGYEMVQKVRQQSAGAFELTEGALYPALHKLEASGLLTTEKVHIGKRVRKYYRLTPAGAKARETKVSEFAEFVRSMQLLLNPKPAAG